MAARRYEQNEDFFVRMFSDAELMKQVMETVGSVLYERLKKKSIKYESPVRTLSAVAEGAARYDTESDTENDNT